ncbi:hypothetical protein BJ508DRAFT_315250 [Ascobolus immersus RN42]|uniref:Uncharacterized protein n=1 Tax=Ascobolus immersus RN42 TaxID=1160509 RepID=A0A3N4HHW4_ASCIM|nr:hypothetical protein BJ508DRAFT_315250 [Ascobolus immersus RN42]
MGMAEDDTRNSGNKDKTERRAIARAYGVEEDDPRLFDGTWHQPSIAPKRKRNTRPQPRPTQQPAQQLPPHRPRYEPYPQQHNGVDIRGHLHPLHLQLRPEGVNWQPPFPHDQRFNEARHQPRHHQQQQPHPQAPPQQPRPQAPLQGPRPQDSFQQPRPQGPLQGPRPQDSFQQPRPQAPPQQPRPQGSFQQPRPQAPQQPRPQDSFRQPRPQAPLQGPHQQTRPTLPQPQQPRPQDLPPPPQFPSHGSRTGHRQHNEQVFQSNPSQSNPHYEPMRPPHLSQQYAIPQLGEDDGGLVAMFAASLEKGVFARERERRIRLGLPLSPRHTQTMPLPFRGPAELALPPQYGHGGYSSSQAGRSSQAQHPRSSQAYPLPEVREHPRSSQADRSSQAQHPRSSQAYPLPEVRGGFAHASGGVTSSQAPVGPRPFQASQGAAGQYPSSHRGHISSHPDSLPRLSNARTSSPIRGNPPVLTSLNSIHVLPRPPRSPRAPPAPQHPIRSSPPPRVPARRISKNTRPQVSSLPSSWDKTPPTTQRGRTVKLTQEGSQYRRETELESRKKSRLAQYNMQKKDMKARRGIAMANVAAGAAWDHG